MTNEEIIELGTNLGLIFRKDSNFPDMLESNRVVFDGCNGQRFLIDGSWENDKIYEEMGESLKLMGRRELKVELSNLMNIMSDN
jgi:hypothetical protein